MTAASSLCHRKCRAIPLIVLLTMAPALTACGSTHHLAEQQTTAPSAANEDAATQTSGPRVPDRRTRAVVSCDDLDADPLRGLSDEEPACIPSAPRTKTPREECPDICLNVIIVEVDEDNWKVVKVQVLNERDKSRPAIVHRTAGCSATGPEVGKRVEFTCSYQYDEHGMPHYGECCQSSAQDRASYDRDNLYIGPGDFMNDL